MKRIYVPESFVYMLHYLRKVCGELKYCSDSEITSYIIPIPCFLKDEKAIYKLFKKLKRIKEIKQQRDIMMEMLEEVELK